MRGHHARAPNTAVPFENQAFSLALVHMPLYGDIPSQSGGAMRGRQRENGRMSRNLRRRGMMGFELDKI